MGLPADIERAVVGILTSVPLKDWIATEDYIYKTTVQFSGHPEVKVALKLVGSMLNSKGVLYIDDKLVQGSENIAEILTQRLFWSA